MQNLGWSISRHHVDNNNVRNYPNLGSFISWRDIGKNGAGAVHLPIFGVRKQTTFGFHSVQWINTADRLDSGIGFSKNRVVKIGAIIADVD